MALPQDYPLVAYYRGYCAERLGRSGREDFALASRQSTRYVFPNRPESLVVLRRATRGEPATTRPPTSSSGRSFSPADRPTRLSPSGRGRARSTRGSPSSTATSASPSSTRGAPPPDALRVFEEGMSADPDERRALPGRRPGAEPPRPRARGADRLAAAVPRDALSRRRSSSSWPSPSPRPAASPRRRRSSPGASSPARSSARTSARSTSR